jgi:hypothetical protein
MAFREGVLSGALIFRCSDGRLAFLVLVADQKKDREIFSITD